MRPGFPSRPALALLKADDCRHTSAGRYLCLICQVLARRRWRRAWKAKGDTMASRLAEVHRHLDQLLTDEGVDR